MSNPPTPTVTPNAKRKGLNVDEELDRILKSTITVNPKKPRIDNDKMDEENEFSDGESEDLTQHNKDDDVDEENNIGKIEALTLAVKESRTLIHNASINAEKQQQALSDAEKSKNEAIKKAKDEKKIADDLKKRLEAAEKLIADKEKLEILTANKSQSNKGQ